MAKIIEIKGSQLKLPIKEGSNTKFCDHRQVQVDQEQRNLECTVCKKILDPFDFVLGWARKERNTLYYINEMEKKLDQLNIEKENLTREVQNLKAQKRRLQK